MKALKFTAEGLSKSPMRSKLLLVEMGRDTQLGEKFTDDKFFKKNVLGAFEKLLGKNKQAVGIIGRDQSGYMNGLLIIESNVLKDLKKLKEQQDADSFADWQFKFRDFEFQENPEDPCGLNKVYQFWNEDIKPYELLII